MKPQPDDIEFLVSALREKAAGDRKVALDPELKDQHRVAEQLLRQAERAEQMADAFEAGTALLVLERDAEKHRAAGILAAKSLLREMPEFSEACATVLQAAMVPLRQHHRFCVHINDASDHVEGRGYRAFIVWEHLPTKIPLTGPFSGPRIEDALKMAEAINRHLGLSESDCGDIVGRSMGLLECPARSAVGRP